MKGNVIKNIFFPFIFIFLINGCNSTSTNVSSSWESESDLKEFLKLLENDEPYIGFFNIEKNSSTLSVSFVVTPNFFDFLTAL